MGEEANSSRLASNSFNSDNGEASLLKTVNQVITAKLKLNLTTEQKASVRETALAYRDALNFTSDAAFDNDKSSNGALVTKKLGTKPRPYRTALIDFSFCLSYL
ncbi:hypothetical protein Q5692_12140, partial [Microcoleus sp. C2C3]